MEVGLYVSKDRKDNGTNNCPMHTHTHKHAHTTNKKWKNLKVTHKPLCGKEIIKLRNWNL